MLSIVPRTFHVSCRYSYHPHYKMRTWGFQRLRRLPKVVLGEPGVESRQSVSKAHTQIIILLPNTTVPKRRNLGICFSILCPEGYWIFSLLFLLISFVQAHPHHLTCCSWGRQGIQAVKIQKVVHGKSLEQGGRESIKCIFSVPFFPLK